MRDIRRAVVGAVVQQWLETAQISQFISAVIGQLAAVAVFAWLARQSGRGDVVSAIAFGVVLMVAWRASVFRLGFMVVGSNNQGTLELEMMSRAPMFWIMLGKTLALVSFFALTGLLCFATAVVVGGLAPTTGNPAILAVSLLVTLAAIVALAYVFAPLTFLAGGQAGFMNAVFPVGILLSGFVQPTALLPTFLEVPARLLPTSWATEALMMGLQGESASAIAPGWAASLTLTVATLALTAWMFARCEAVVRGRGAQ